MNRFGIEVTPKHSPKLDPDYTPLYLFNQAFLKEAKKPLGIAVERASGQMVVTRTFIHGTPDKRDADLYYVDRLVKSLLWVKGGFKVYICGDEDVYQTIKAAYAPGGSRAFDAEFMSGVYEKPFEVVSCQELPAEKNNPQAIGYASLSAVEGKSTVKALTVGGVACTEATVLDGSYEIQRPFVLVTKQGVTLSAAAQAFFDFATSSSASDLIKNAGAVPVAK